ncbi:MAG: hypothetical protein NUV98_04940, partial [Candidatus Roizmanbacteria bacterium]|nr:hypothetical protein [Candidatus Roizmanbacteria bacterium]
MNRWYLLLLLLFSGSLFLNSRTAYACFFSYDPWFASSITLDAESLPEGVELVIEPSAPYRNSITNHSSVPFYLVSKDGSDNERLENDSESMNGYLLYYRLVNGTVFSYEEARIKEGQAQWRKLGYDVDEYHVPDYDRAYEPDRGVYIRKYLEEVLDILPYYKEGPTRPDNIEIPELDLFSFTAFYGENPVTITGQITYSLNENFQEKHFSCPTNDRSNIVDRLFDMMFFFIVIPLKSY